MALDAGRSERITRDQAEALLDHLVTVATQLERQISALETAAAEPGCRTAPRLLADARERRTELSEARSHIDTLTALTRPDDGGAMRPTGR